MTKNGYSVNSRATVAFDVLTSTERAAIEKQMHWLARSSPDRWPALGVPRISPDEPLYLVRVDDSLRLIVQADPEGSPEILDVVRHETLQHFRKLAENGARP